jgi:hypothetical protein
MTDIDKILADIAHQQLKIETLKTRKSDSLDFHDVSVWSLRAALLCAFEAGRKAARTRPRVIETGKRGTCYQATIEASYKDIVEVWGEPSKGDGYKTEAEWIIRLPNRGMTITIYNYKNSRSYADKYPEITEVRKWHIGGHKTDVVDRLLGMMTGTAKLVHRAG